MRQEKLWPILTVRISQTRKCCAEWGQQPNSVFLRVSVWQVVGKRKQERSTPLTEERLSFLFSEQGIKRANATAQARWHYFKRAQLHVKVKVFVRLQVFHLKLFIYDSFQQFYLL